jgi:hypothetical protein
MSTTTLEKTQLAGLELPRFRFVAVTGLYPANRRQKILSSFSIGELENKETLGSVQSALENADRLIK